MSRIKTISPESATDKAKDLLNAVRVKLGMVPNMARAMANSPAVLEGYLQLSGSLAHGLLDAKSREQLALTVSQANQCDYCLAAHSAIGKMVGLSGDQIEDARVGTAVDPKTETLLRFAGTVMETHGRVSDSDLDDMHAAGFDDGVIAEVVAHVALNVFTNYFNNVAETEIDFPHASPLKQKSTTTS